MLFILSAAFVLCVSGAAKIASTVGKSRVLTEPDPILNVRFNHLLIVIGVIELAIAVMCLTHPTRRLILGLLFVLSLNLFTYHAALWFIHWHGYCPCFGSLTAAIHLSPRQADLLAQLSLFYLLFGSLFFLASPSFLKNRFGANAMKRISSFF